jgi:hypothetical protein
LVTCKEKIAWPPDDEVVEIASFEIARSAFGLAASTTVKGVTAWTVPPKGSKSITLQSPRFDDVVRVNVALELGAVIALVCTA